MKIKSEQLARQLRAGPQPLIWLSGDEPLLQQESADRVRSHYREQGFLEREILTVERGFDWANFLQAAGNLSLFAERKIIELRLASAKLDDAGKSALAQYLQEPNPDYLVLISSPRLEGGTLNTKWFKAIEQQSLLVQIWPVNRENLAAWLEQRLLREGIRPQAEALQLLEDRIEGNLLAAMQEIEKLKLLAGDGTEIVLDLDTVTQVVADNARYNAFQAVDAALAGDAARAQRVLDRLRGEGVFPLAILAALITQLRSLLPMLEKIEQGQGVNAVMQSARVWFNRKQIVGRALGRLRSDDIWNLLRQARVIDQSIKGMSSANPWDELSLLMLQLAGQRPATAAAARP